jgi:hypothetical protein
MPHQCHQSSKTGLIFEESSNLFFMNFLIFRNFGNSGFFFKGYFFRGDCRDCLKNKKTFIDLILCQ